MGRCKEKLKTYFFKNTEKYPSLAEGIGLENRQGVTAAGVRIPLSPPFFGDLLKLVKRTVC